MTKTDSRKPWTKSDLKLQERHLTILGAIGAAKGRGLTRSNILDLTGISDLAQYLGPKWGEDIVEYETKYGKRSLIYLGLVKAEQEITGVDAQVYYKVTDRGESCLEYYHTLPRKDYDEIPGTLLDPIVKKMKASRVYGFDRWTVEDLETVRSMLPSEYVMCSLEGIRQQMINRRKRGLYGDADRLALSRKLAHIKKLIQGYWSDEIPLDEVVSVIRSNKPQQ